MFLFSVWHGSFHLFGVELKCHVLSDGNRIVEADSLTNLFKAMGDPGEADIDKTELGKLGEWLRQG